MNRSPEGGLQGFFIIDPFIIHRGSIKMNRTPKGGGGGGERVFEDFSSLIHSLFIGVQLK